MSIITSSINNSNAAQVATHAETKYNVAYGKHSLQKMDVYLPANRSADYTSAIILIHGGGWNSGSKSSFDGYIDSFKRRLPHYAFFNINYRLANNTTIFPAQENDVKAAVDFIVQHAQSYQVNTNKLVLLGASAGAHLAMLQAYKHTSPQVRAVIDFFGPTNLTAMYNDPWHPLIPYLLNTLTRTTPSANAAVYNNASPAGFITSQSAPTLILQGGRDNVVHPSQSKLLKQQLDSAGVKNEMIIYPAEGHGWHGSTLSNSFDRIVNFLQQVV